MLYLKESELSSRLRPYSENMNKRSSPYILLFGSSALALTAFHPSVLFALAVVQLLLILLFVAGRQWSLRRSHSYSAADLPSEVHSSPFFSIQIATYSEPPELVIQTLDSLRGLKGAPYEVLVVDNNTPDPQMYEPVEAYCQENGFRFFHFDDVKGAKAGALNLVRQRVDDRTSHVIILDADYMAEPDLLEQAARHVGGPALALLQFPQSYRNGNKQCPLAHEYASFFDVYMTTAQEARSVLSTGTAAVVERHALEAVGGWPTTTITEDADLGLLFAAHGYRTLYVHRAVARGLMPTCPGEFLKQRSRWIKGNLQCLGKHRLSELPLEGRCSAFLQLTAWVSPLVFFPLIVLIATGYAVYGAAGSLPQTALALANASAGIYLAFSALFFLRSDPSRPFTTRAEAFLVHLGTYWTSLVAVMEALSGKDLKFERTSKEINGGEGTSAISQGPIWATLLCLGFAAICLHVSPQLALAWTFLGLPWVGRTYLENVLRKIEKRSLSNV